MPSLPLREHGQICSLALPAIDVATSEFKLALLDDCVKVYSIVPVRNLKQSF